MSKTVHVDLDERGYDIRIGRDLRAGSSLKGTKAIKALIISDSNVDKLYGDKCAGVLSSFGIEVKRTFVPAGEESKDIKFVKQLYDEAMKAGLDRSSVIVALGGGMVGDLAGFVAATFLRGIRFIQVPTTVLAMVDSSVGGKTGINLPQGKNLVGSFYQPVEVTADLSTLNTLPVKEYVSGLAEVVKYGVIWDAKLFGLIENNVQKILGRDLDFLEGVVARCCEIKAEIVKIDEKETGVRAILNFGHTMGHALEKALGYGKWLHGEAVAAGMAFAAKVSVAEKSFPASECERLQTLLKNLGLPVGMKDFGVTISWRDVRDAMASDKKSLSGVPRFVLAEKLGSVVFGCEVSEEALEKVFSGSF
jgi:3-dehydroquinate synthase